MRVIEASARARPRVRRRRRDGRPVTLDRLACRVTGQSPRDFPRPRPHVQHERPDTVCVARRLPHGFIERHIPRARCFAMDRATGRRRAHAAARPTTLRDRTSRLSCSWSERRRLGCDHCSIVSKPSFARRTIERMNGPFASVYCSLSCRYIAASSRLIVSYSRAISG